MPPLDVLKREGPKTVKKSVEEIFKEIDASEGFALVPGDVIYKETPPENVNAMVYCWAEYKLIKR